MKVNNEQLLCLCLQGKTQTEIAKALKMTKAQICRRMNTPQFKTMLAEYRKKVLDGTVTYLTANVQKATATLVRLTDSENEFIQLHSASKIIGLAHEWGITNDLLADIEELKQKQNEEL